MTPPILLAVPNVSEGRDAATIAAIASAFADDAGAGVRVLDIHSDADHHRSVFTLAGRPDALVDALLRGARVALERIDVVSRAEAGPAHDRPASARGRARRRPDRLPAPRGQRGGVCRRAGSRRPCRRGAAAARLPLRRAVGRRHRGTPARTRSQLRRGGVVGLAARLAAGDGRAHARFRPRAHALAGRRHARGRKAVRSWPSTCSSRRPRRSSRRARSPSRSVKAAQAGCRACARSGSSSSGGVAQVSMNVERPLELPLARVVDAVRAHAVIASAELVGLAPAAALRRFPARTCRCRASIPSAT